MSLTNLLTAERFFCVGMTKGWAGGNDGYPMQEFADWKEITYKDQYNFPDWALVDRWGCCPDTGQTSGQTIIYHRFTPVWMMWYGKGTYSKDMLPLLRSSLLLAYESKMFFGGRGPNICGVGDLVYTNHHEGDFAQFSGTERINHISTGQERGRHRYWGGSLFYLKK